MENKAKPGSIGEEITRLISARSETGMAPPLLISAALGFTHFVLGLAVFGHQSEEMPTITDIWGVLNGSDILHHVRLRFALSSFIPAWLDSPLKDRMEDFTAEKIADTYNNWVISKQKE